MEKLNPAYAAAFLQKGNLIALGVIVTGDLRADALPTAARQAKDRAQALISSDPAEIEKTIECYSSFFQQSGYRCPLGGQFQKTKQSGLPEIMPLVDILLATEMGFGVLAGVQDRDKVEGQLVFDVAEAGAILTGMRSSMVCKAGEPILRDAKDIIASYMQGPDAKTKVLKTTTTAVFFFFSAPGVSEEKLAAAMTFAEESLKSASTILEKAFLKSTGL